MNNEIKTVIKTLPTEKSPRSDRFAAEFDQTSAPQTIHKIKNEGTLPNSSYKATIIMIYKLYKVTTTKNLQPKFLDKHRCKNSQ
jgi:hypothetical protein